MENRGESDSHFDIKKEISVNRGKKQALRKVIGKID